MKVEDINRVNSIVMEIQELGIKHSRLKSILGHDKWGCQQQVRLEIGGDCHGNGRYKTVITNVQNVDYVVKLISKEISEVWGKIVSLRVELRELGVEL